MGNQTLDWTGTFANDQNQTSAIYEEADSLVTKVLKLTEEAKGYWIDSNDTKGNNFKKEVEDSLNQIKASITKAQANKDALFKSLDDTMREINDENKY